MPTPPAAPLPATFDADERLRWVERVAHLMDSQFRLPGTRFRFGLDPLLGLLPIVGDLSTTAVSVALLLTMLRHGASGAVVVRMALNIFLDTVVGGIPLIGNVFDFAYKSNERNVALLRPGLGGAAAAGLRGGVCAGGLGQRAAAALGLALLRCGPGGERVVA